VEQAAEIAGSICARWAVFIEGRLQTRQWEDKQTGQQRYTTEVVADNMILLGGRGGGDAGDAADAEPTYARSGRAKSADAEPTAGYTPDSSLEPIGRMRTCILARRAWGTALGSNRA